MFLCRTDGKRGKISDVFEQDGEDGGGPLQRTLSQPDFFYDGDEDRVRQPRGSMFARPGFGSVAFRCVNSAYDSARVCCHYIITHQQWHGYHKLYAENRGEGRLYTYQLLVAMIHNC